MIFINWSNNTSFATKVLKKLTVTIVWSGLNYETKIDFLSCQHSFCWIIVVVRLTSLGTNSVYRYTPGGGSHLAHHKFGLGTTDESTKGIYVCLPKNNWVESKTCHSHKDGYQRCSHSDTTATFQQCKILMRRLLYNHCVICLNILHVRVTSVHIQIRWIS